MNDFQTFLNNCLSELLAMVPERLYLVGGYLRENLLLNDTLDFDFAVYENTLEISRELARKTNGVFVLLDPDRKTGRVVWNRKRNNFELNFDLATICGKSIEEDLRLRDLTINSIALELNRENIAKVSSGKLILNKSEIIDPTGGYDDLNNKLIRTYSKSNLEADPLRILRVFRFAGKTGFGIDHGTINFIKEIPELILKPAKERVLKEFTDIMANPVSNIQFKQMYRAELLPYLFFDLGQIDPVMFPKAIKNLENFELILNNLSEYFSYNNEISESLNAVIPYHTRASLLKVVILLHSLKTDNFSQKDYFHKVEKFLKIFTFSAIEQQVILNHLKFCAGWEEIASIEITPTSLFHFFKVRQKEVTGSLLLNFTLAFSDDLIKSKINRIFEYYFADKILSEQPKLLDGNMIIKEFKLKPGPEIGILLNFLQEAQAVKKVNNYQEALEFVSEKLKIK
jgi:tRNA nucleotidyltransferase/poly(A) polymerase